jgi:hypothetical protein
LILGVALLARTLPAIAESQAGVGELGTEQKTAGEADPETTAKAAQGVSERPTLTVPSARSVPGGTGPRAPTGNVPGLDSLLQLPSGFVGSSGPSVAGTSESEWRRRFEKGKKDVDEARERLAHTKKELDGAAVESGASQWSVAPPNSSGGPSGGGAAPVSFKLRQEIKQNRLDLEKAVRALRDLEIEANLAEVPLAWRGEGASSELTPSELGQVID